MDKEELLYNQIYERTKEFGRTHFIKEIMNLERENKQRANAIQFVENHMKYNNGMNCADMNDLLEILKGEDNV